MATETVSAVELEPTPPEVKHYHWLKMLTGLIGLGVTLTFLGVMAFVAGPAVDEFVRGIVGDNRWLRLIGIGLFYAAALEFLTLPLDFYSGYIIEHRYELSNQSLPQWLWKKTKGYLIGAPFALGMLVGLYALIWYAGERWWLWATLAWMGLTLVLGQLVPVLILPLFYKVTRLEDVELVQRLQRLCEGTGLNITGVFRLHMSAETRKANAALTGLGKTRRVLLGDTLLEKFSPEEIEVVFAHEIGHHVHRHLPKLVAWIVATSFIGFYLIDVILRHSASALGYPAFDDPAALPLLMLVPAVFGLVLTPVQNALSRYFERQCDRYALERTHQPEAYRSAFVKLARMNKSDADPHPLVVWLFEDHPPIRERLAMADAPA